MSSAWMAAKDGRQWRFTGRYESPSDGEWFLNHGGHPERATAHTGQSTGDDTRRHILEPLDLHTSSGIFVEGDQVIVRHRGRLLFSMPRAAVSSRFASGSDGLREAAKSYFHTTTHLVARSTSQGVHAARKRLAAALSDGGMGDE